MPLTLSVMLPFTFSSTRRWKTKLHLKVSALQPPAAVRRIEAWPGPGLALALPWPCPLLGLVACFTDKGPEISVADGHAVHVEGSHVGKARGGLAVAPKVIVGPNAKPLS
jgi:hypothetical protein